MRALIDRFSHLPPEYRGGMTNHLPMALHALHELGADDARMAQFAASYVRRFDDIEPPRPAAPAVPAADWRGLRGQPEAYVPLHGAFAAMVERQGVDETLRQSLPDLWSGVSAAAFHGLIRTGHAVQSGHVASLTQALAYWAWRWQPLSAPASEGVPMPPDEWVAALAEHACDLSAAQGLISGRMQMVQTMPAFIGLSGRLQFLPGDLQATLHALWALAAQRYAATSNFTVLHMVTACRAIQVLLPWLSDGPTARDALARSYAAALLVSGAVGPRPSDSGPVPASWPAVVAAAIGSDDDHVVKLVHACRDAFHRCGDGPWLSAAARAVGQH